MLTDKYPKICFEFDLRKLFLIFFFYFRSCLVYLIFSPLPFLTSLLLLSTAKLFAAGKKDKYAVFGQHPDAFLSRPEGAKRVDQYL